ncbi:hypothetical protein B566_EDAN004702 [Ephemera danica]|nr:hypothetical protein B566_EDAN004702 [Ephemera danica]
MWKTIEFSVAGERGDCAFLAGSNVTITWNPIKLCSPTVKFFGSNKTACSVINSWLSCGNQIQNQKLPADPYCQLFGPATCGQSATYQCTASNNVTIFQSLTQGLLFERVSNWVYFRQENFAEWHKRTEQQRLTRTSGSITLLFR